MKTGTSKQPVMSCAICLDPYDDGNNDKQCYSICSEGHTVCHECLVNILKHNAACPLCRRALLENPVRVRIGTTVQPTQVVQKQSRVVMVVDRSYSMKAASGAQGAPKRIELAMHMMKIIIACCKKLNLAYTVYTFSDSVELVADETIDSQLRQRPSGITNLGMALNRVFENHGSTSKYFVFTDGEPSDFFEEAVARYANTQLHLLAFGSDVSVDLLREVMIGQKHTISYIEDVRSLAGYIIPVFVWAMTEKTAVLDQTDDATRKKFVMMLGSQVSGSTKQYNLRDIVVMLREQQKQSVTTYSRDLETDTAGVSEHSRIEYSFANRKNWNNFGKYYLLHALHCHKYLIPGNSFDPSLRHYRTAEYNTIYEQIAGIPNKIEFVAFMASEEQRDAASQYAAQFVSQSMTYIDSYHPSSTDEGCIGPDEMVLVRQGMYWIEKKMEDVKPGEYLLSGKIKWIIRVANLNNGNPIPLYNGVTGSHPVYNGKEWIKAKHQVARVAYTRDVVYDVVMEDPTIGSMKVNDIQVAVVGFAVPNMVHPYWGTQKVIDDIRMRYPDGGFVDVDARNFKYTNGTVSSLFS